jgi:hypothetical protein
MLANISIENRLNALLYTINNWRFEHGSCVIFSPWQQRSVCRDGFFFVLTSAEMTFEMPIIKNKNKNKKVIKTFHSLNAGKQGKEINKWKRGTIHMGSVSWRVFEWVTIALLLFLSLNLIYVVMIFLKLKIHNHMH